MLLTSPPKIKDITLLSMSEAHKIGITNPKLFKCDYGYWLRSQGKYIYSAALVLDNKIDPDGDYVENDYAIRPALIIDPNTSFRINDNFKLGNYTWTIISDNLAFIDGFIKYSDNTPLRLPFNTEGNGSDFKNSEIKKFLDEFLHNMGFNTGRRSSRGSRRENGNDLLYRMNISFDEAVHGTKKDIKVEVEDECDECSGEGGFNSHTCPECKGSGTVTRTQNTMFGSFLSRTPCTHCNGTGTSFEKICTKCHGSGRVVKPKTLTITVPKGVDTGNRLRISGKGEAGRNGGRPGDLYIEFTVKDDDFYQRDDNDIYIVVPLTITEAVLGCKKMVTTIHGNVELSIPEGTKNNSKLRLKGKGIDSDINGKKGDMYVITNVIIPSKLNRKQKELFKELASTDLDNDSEFTKYNKILNK